MSLLSRLGVLSAAGGTPPPPPQSFELWPSTDGPGTVASDDGIYTLGMEFTLAQPCALNEIRFWSAPGAGILPSSVVIFDVATTDEVAGTLISDPDWSGAAGSGWVSCPYDSPPVLAVNTNYRVAVFGGDNTHNWYSVTSAYWTSGDGENGLTTGPITAYASGDTDVGQDSYDASGNIDYPSNSAVGGNYWIDLDVSPQFNDATTTGPAAGGYTPTAQTAADIPLGGPYPPWVQDLGGGAFLVEECSFSAAFNCYENNVTFKGCSWSVASPGGFAVGLMGSDGPYLLSYCELGGTGSGNADVVGYCAYATQGNATFEYCNMFWAEQPINFSENNLTVDNCYIHDLVAPPDSHNECIYIAGDNDTISITNSTLENPLDQTAVIYITPGATYDGVTIAGNFLAGGGWTLYCGGGEGSDISNMVISGNAFSTIYFPECGYFGTDADIPTFGSDGNEWEANYWYDGPSQGQAVSP